MAIGSGENRFAIENVFTDDNDDVGCMFLYIILHTYKMYIYTYLYFSPPFSYTYLFFIFFLNATPIERCFAGEHCSGQEKVSNNFYIS